MFACSAVATGSLPDCCHLGWAEVEPESLELNVLICACCCVIYDAFSNSFLIFHFVLHVVSGWVEGTGLGSSASGRVAPVSAVAPTAGGGVGIAPVSENPMQTLRILHKIGSFSVPFDGCLVTCGFAAGHVLPGHLAGHTPLGSVDDQFLTLCSLSGHLPVMRVPSCF